MSTQCQITEAELEHYIRVSKRSDGCSPEPHEYEELAKDAEGEGRYYAAALYTELAGMRSHPDTAAVMRLEERVNELLMLAGNSCH